MEKKGARLPFFARLISFCQEFGLLPEEVSRFRRLRGLVALTWRDDEGTPPYMAGIQTFPRFYLF